MPIFAVFLLKKGSLCLVWVTENPDTQDLPKKVPSRTNSLLKMATLSPNSLAGIGTFGQKWPFETTFQKGAKNHF